jgi:ketosteroid isomerase-like protein
LDDTYAINVAKTEYREGFNTRDVERVLSVFAPEFTDNSDGRPSRYGKDAPIKLRRYLAELFEEYEVRLTIIMVSIVVLSSAAYDYGWHEFTLTPRRGGEAQLVRKRYLELWGKQANGEWRIIRYIDNADLPDVVD